MGKKVLIKNARAVVTCDSADHVFNDADILINGPAIEKICKNISAEDAEVLDGRDKLIYPGLINTHHHFFQTFIRNNQSIDYPNMSVVEWLGKIYPIFQKVDSDIIYYSSLTAMADLLKHGCTCAFDHQYCYTSVSGKELVDRQMEAAGQLGIRYHAGRGYIALAVVILGRRNPLGVFISALIIGFAEALQYSIQTLGVPIPSQVFTMFPYVVAVLVLLFSIGRSSDPAALGVPYERNKR